MNGMQHRDGAQGEDGRPGQPDPTRPMPSMPPDSEEFSSSRHDPGYGRPPQYDAGRPPAHQGQGWDPGPPQSNAHYPVQPHYPHQPGFGGPHHPQQGAPGQGQPAPQGRPVREAKRSGGCFGVVVALFMAVFAGVGTILLLNLWMQAGSGGSLPEVVELYRMRPRMLLEGVTGLPALVGAGVLCLIAAFCLPSRLGALRGLGVFLMLVANLAYAYGVILWIHPYYPVDGLFAAARQRWQTVGELWPTVLAADAVLVPAFLLLTLIAVVASRPRRV